MIGGSTSSWPAWGVWLVVAIVLTVVTGLLALSIAMGGGFGTRTKRRVVLGLLLVAVLGAWGGYRLTSNNRWAARSVVTNMLDALPASTFDGSTGIRVETSDRNCVNGASAWSQVWRSVPATPFPASSAEELSAELEVLEDVADSLTSDGYRLERGIIVSSDGEGQGFHALATRGARTAYLTFDPSGVLIEAAATACNARSFVDLFESRDSTSTIARFDLANVCAVGNPTSPFPAACN
ncbi:MAG: hypothetical protein AAGC53_13985 [Actinomycetota bacterium]